MSSQVRSSGAEICTNYEKTTFPTFGIVIFQEWCFLAQKYGNKFCRDLHDVQFLSYIFSREYYRLWEKCKKPMFLLFEYKFFLAVLGFVETSDMLFVIFYLKHILIFSSIYLSMQIFVKLNIYFDWRKNKKTYSG